MVSSNKCLVHKQKFRCRCKTKMQLNMAKTLTFCFKHSELCPPLILSWNQDSELLSRSPNFLIWITSLIIFIFGTNGGSCFFSVLYYNHFTLTDVMLASVFGVCNHNALAFAAIMVTGCDEIIPAMKETRRLLGYMENICWKKRQYQRLG